MFVLIPRKIVAAILISIPLTFLQCSSARADSEVCDQNFLKLNEQKDAKLRAADFERATASFTTRTWTTPKYHLALATREGFLPYGDKLQAYVRIDSPALAQGPMKTVLLVHGFGQNSTFFDALTEELVQRKGVRVIRIDLNNSGRTLLKSGKQDSPTLLDDAGLVRSVIEKLNLTDVLLMGHSRGHGVTSIVASQIPERISYQVGLNPYVRWLPDYFFDTALYPEAQSTQMWADLIDPKGILGVKDYWNAFFGYLQRSLVEATDMQAFTSANPLSLETLLSQVPAEVPRDAFNSGVYRNPQIAAALEIAKGMSPEDRHAVTDVTDFYKTANLLKTKTLIIGGGEDYRFAPESVTDEIRAIKMAADQAAGTHTFERVTDPHGDHFMPAREPGKVVDILDSAFSGKIFQ
jgi:pimeloyl-ACP methyl ester carboxylesterase